MPNLNLIPHPRVNVMTLLVVLWGVRLTESISAGKYPEYRDYQGSTPMLVPWPRFGGAT